MKDFLRKIKRAVYGSKFESSNYWISRYQNGGNSGSGSYGQLAEFKARILNQFVAEKHIKTVIEFGCGDGNQLALANYPSYIGLDISPVIIKTCIANFQADKTKSFFIYNHEAFLDNSNIFQCDLALSLDVIYHLVEPEVYVSYLRHLFGCGREFVIVYSSNANVSPSATAIHERHREFTEDVKKIAPEWELSKIVENEHKPKSWSDDEGSIANFYFYKKSNTNSI